MNKIELARAIYKHPEKVGISVGFKDLTEIHGEWIREMVWGNSDYTLMAHRAAYKSSCLAVAMSLIMVFYPTKNIIFLRKADNDVSEMIRMVNKILKSQILIDICAVLHGVALELTEEGIVKWLGKRVIPKNRQFVDEILKTLGLSVNNTKGIIDVCMGLSLNDSYWVVPADFDGKFADYNLYENRFSEALSLVAYTGVGGSNEAFSTSPELTTNGMLRKAWRFVDDDGIYLYKGGTEGAANTGNEPYSEYYACQIAEAMGLPCVQYDLENWKGILASKCRLFTDIDTAFVPIGRFLSKCTLKDCLDYYASLGDDFYEQLCSMLVFDSVIYNEDRHFGNFGVLRDNHTGQIISPAPIFDNGLSLFNFAMPDDFKNLKEYAKTRSNPYRISYEEICKEVMGSKQKAQLRRLIGFRFKRHPSLNLPEERLTAIEKQISERVRELLSIPSRRKSKQKDEPTR